MTENKRFTDDGFEAIEDQSFTDNLTKKTYYVDYFDEIVDLCNSLWEQTQRFEKHNKDLMEDNGQLKQFNQKLNDELQETMGYLALKSGVEKENEQLKSDNKCYVKRYSELFEGYIACKKENEQLKQELVVYRKVASCSNCNYHNYDWYDDGDEFEVCDKGNDVTDRICEDWEEL